MKTSSAKNKGRRLQNWVRDYLTELFDFEEGDVKSTSMGVTGEDIQLSPAARKKVPYSIECKSRNKFVIYSMYEQARKNSKTYEPLLIIKEDRNKPLVVLDAEHFLNLLLTIDTYKDLLQLGLKGYEKIPPRI
jgi:hypothetical protein